MADEQPSLHIDTDWKKQAQEEKKRLAEQEEQQKAKAATSPAGAGAPAGGAAAGTETATGKSAAGGRRAGPREFPPASFATLVQAIVTQVLFYLGDLSPQGGAPSVNLDLAKHQIDTLQVLEEKTVGNLNETEKRLLDGALYEVRMRYVSVASEYT